MYKCSRFRPIKFIPSEWAERRWCLCHGTSVWPVWSLCMHGLHVMKLLSPALVILWKKHPWTLWFEGKRENCCFVHHFWYLVNITWPPLQCLLLLEMLTFISHLWVTPLEIFDRVCPEILEKLLQRSVYSSNFKCNAKQSRECRLLWYYRGKILLSGLTRAEKVTMNSLYWTQKFRGQSRSITFTCSWSLWCVSESCKCDCVHGRRTALTA